VKDPRGRKKKIDTDGFACPHPDCPYWGITDAKVHAVIGFGSHGKIERIQDFFCQACKHKVTSRRHTALYRLRSPSKDVALALHFLAVGVIVSQLEEVLKVGEFTLRTWLTRAGMHAERVHHHFCHDLEVQHIQFDELFARLKQEMHNIWIWVAMDATTKIIPSLVLGPRIQETAYQLIHDLYQRLRQGCVPAFSADGLRHYFYAATAHWGQWVTVEGQRRPVWQLVEGFLFAEFKKFYRRRKIVRTQSTMLWGEQDDFKARLRAIGLTGVIQTAFIERLNLTIRQSVAYLIRRTWGIAIHPDELLLHLEWWRAYYHFARYHQSLRVELAAPVNQGNQQPRRYRSRTPAMAAGLTTHQWSVLELLSYPVP
jgi:IS1 family transposase/transposase-like protein